jgi:hypothetical protein
MNTAVRKEIGLNMGNLQARANLCNTLFITRNGQVSSSSPLVSSLESAYLSRFPGKEETPGDDPGAI